MVKNEDLLNIISVPEHEEEMFKNVIKKYRKKYIKPAKELVVEIFEKNTSFKQRLLEKKDASGVILDVREFAYSEFLKEEAVLNREILNNLSDELETPNQIMNNLISEDVLIKTGEALYGAIKNICGKYAGHIYPYIYMLSLSNTNSRRSRSGSTFESIIYTIYDLLEYPYDSQKKVGSKLFQKVGLGKKVDSILPGIEQFEKIRSKTIIGTMKTSLRERWQEVAEEIERTKVPSIHLLTVDENIAVNKAREMNKHNIVVVGLKKVAEGEGLKESHNIISFEDYLFVELPQLLNYWKNEQV